MSSEVCLWLVPMADICSYFEVLVLDKWLNKVGDWGLEERNAVS